MCQLPWKLCQAQAWGFHVDTETLTFGLNQSMTKDTGEVILQHWIKMGPILGARQLNLILLSDLVWKNLKIEAKFLSLLGSEVFEIQPFRRI